MKLRLLFLFSILLLNSCRDPDAQFAEKLVVQFEQKSINSKNMDWKTFREKVFNSFKVSKDSAIRMALKLNNNPHTYYSMPGKILKADEIGTVNKDTCRLFGYLKTEDFANVGYIKIPRFMPSHNEVSANRQNSIKYIREILNSIQNQDKQNLKAWIIDLRYNYGGDMWPMLISLSPFFENGKLGYFQLSKITEVWQKKANQIYLEHSSQNNRVFNSTVSYQLKNKHIKVAVILGKATASAGEATAIALKSLPNVKFFGLTTRGLTTSNQPINMGHHETLVLTTGYMHDVNGRKYLNGIIPDYKTCTYEELNRSLNNWIYDTSQ